MKHTIGMDISRRGIMRGAMALGGTLALGGYATAARSGGGGGQISVRWLGGGVVEMATPDYKQIAYGDAWIWNNAGWSRFSVEKPPEYATKEGFVKYVSGKHPDAVFVLLSHDHGDHMGDFFEMLSALSGAGVPVMATGQSDMFRKGLIPDFQKANLDPKKVVANGGAAMNFGGVSKFGKMTAHLVPAIHSTLLGYPPAGFMLDIGGVRVYHSGDTDLYGDMKMLGERYKPDVATICVGGGPYTMGPEDAATACKWLGVSHAIPVHYAHNPQVLGIEAGEQFRKAMAKTAPKVKVTVMKPGETQTIKV
ncbi:MAG TPA: MBL fold metallo-hydrolase [Xanthobacteraceae bacterium]|jgi:L-ascorbate metabolism protein UlaG (beta-lactamase superfamily)